MATSTEAKTRRDVYAEVTQRVLDALEQGTVPWHMPWSTSGPPRNLRGRFYRGINLFLLGMTPYDDPRWGTYRAVREAGGQVRKGEHGTVVVFWKRINVRDREAPKLEDRRKVVPLLRCYSVFNVEQCDGFEPLLTERAFEPHDEAQRILTSFHNGPTIRYGGSVAGYNVAADEVRLPRPSKFESRDAFYGTAFHELVHSTGHESRLDRALSVDFGSEPYSREELIAEMGSAMLVRMCSLDVQGQDAAYIAGWLRRLQNDAKLVVNAAAAAQKAVDVILGTTFDEPEAQAA